MNNRIIELVNDVDYNCGMLNTADWDYNKIDDTKVEVIGNPEPGVKVKIYWTCFDEPDEGYILTLPGWDSDDIWMSGIAHIPKPIGCEKGDCEPEWILLSKLLTFDHVIKVEIGE